MSGQLAGKVALVTGAAAGIGAGIARRFAEEGARVVITDLDEISGRAVADEIGGRFVAADIRDRADVENAVGTAVSDYGSIDVLVNNAWGGGTIGRVENKSDEQLAHGIALASDGSRYLTGNTLFVDGGSHINGVAWAPDLDAAERDQPV
ncbi:SDR family oxidoreductase [Nocardia nova]|uniref:SDR family oxidoreductase n=1 Tax=Nocardia nova TaxID=37330 RepID=UPI0037A60801